MTADEILDEMDASNFTTDDDVFFYVADLEKEALISGYRELLGILRQLDPPLRIYVPVRNYAQGYNQCLADMRQIIDKTLGVGQ